MNVVGYDTFGRSSHFFNASNEGFSININLGKDDGEDDAPVEGPTFKDLISDPNVVAEDLGGGGRWSDGGKTLSLQEDEHLYIVFRPGWEVCVKTYDLESGVEDTRCALSTAPVLQVAGIHGTVRLTRVRTPDGTIYEYKSPLDIYEKRAESEKENWQQTMTPILGWSLLGIMGFLVYSAFWE